MNIGFFTDTYFPQVSGVSTSVKLLRDELERQGHRVIIFTTTDPDAKPEANVVRLPSVPFVSFDDRRIAYAGFERCLKVAREYDLDLIHTHTEFSLGMAGRYVASRLKIPNVHTYHTLYEKYTHYILNGKLIRPSHVKLLSKLFCNQADGVISPSIMTKTTLRDYGVKVPIQVIATGVEIPEYQATKRQTMRQQLGLSEEDVVLLSLSRLSKEKNIAEVLNAYAKVLQTDPKAKLVIVGDGPEREALEEQARQLGVKPVFVGEVSHDAVVNYYQMADLYINASMSETQGLTYLEAFANRLPIIAKRNDYLASIMTSDSFGQLFEDFSDFADIIVNYLARVRAGEIAKIDIATLYPLSSQYFGEQAFAFYQKVVQAYASQPHSIFDKVYAGAKELYDEILGHDKETVGFIGIGVMGESMARHLMTEGYELVVYTRTKAKAQALLDEGAHWANTPQEVAQQAKVVLTMVGYPQDVEEVYFGEQGLFAGAHAESIFVDMTTSTPTLAKRISEQAKQQQIEALDAPVSGGDLGAREGRLTVMVGGDEDTFERVLPIFECFGKTIKRQGSAGAGQHTKMANQIMIAGTMTGMTELLVYAKSAGLDLESVLETVGAGSAANWSLTNYAPRILRRDYSPGFFAKHFLKDLGIALDEAEKMGLNLPATQLARELYQQLCDKGYENDGTQALIKLWWENE